ncbi:MAG: hypothetical protein H6812_01765 [Phycisphaeraceae bacterium]|nr:hypothetical protein [Phycisphaeraceae bacterium]
MTPMRASSRRWKLARRVVLFLILGAIVNVGVAWGCAAWSHQDIDYVGLVKWYPPHWAYDSSAIEIIHEKKRTTGLGTSMWIGSWTKKTGGYRKPTGEVIDETFWPHENYDEWGRGWMRFVVHGWPLISLRREVWQPHDDAPNASRFPVPVVEVGLLRTGIAIPTSDVGWTHSRALPLTPIWIGFTLNTLLYAVVLYIPFVGLGAYKRHRRTRRGLCPACAYDLAGLTACPECGRKVG